MFKTYKSQSSRKVSRKKHTPDESLVTHSPAPQHPTLQMQSLIGNHATQQMIQRMPTHGVIIGKLGQPKADVTAFGKVIKQNATKYRAVLNSVQAYDQYLIKTKLATDKSTIQGQFQAAITLLNNIITAINGYQGEKGKKAVYILGLKPQIEAEKNKVAVSMLRVISKPVDYSFGQPSFGTILRPDSTVDVYDKNKVGGERGGSSEVTKFGGTGPQGYFKENKNTLTNFEKGMPEGLSQVKQDEFTSEADLKVLESTGGNFEQYNALKNEYELGVKMVGIDSENARMAKRDVAMSRLNDLLGAGVIAKAQMAVRHTDGGNVSGSLMEDASKKGKSGFNMAKDGDFYDPSAGGTKDKTDQVSLEDPELMRQLSRLQLIDLLALQVDRNRKNYYIQTDGAGKVIGLVGIDNDFSMGTSVNVEGRNQELPGISRYVDEELANAILKLDIEMLKALMQDLLSEAEIGALVSRVKKLQEFLKPLKDQGKLIKPNEWDSAMAKNLLAEKIPGKSIPKNYYSMLVEEAKRKK